MTYIYRWSGRGHHSGPARRQGAGGGGTDDGRGCRAWGGLRSVYTLIYMHTLSSHIVERISTYSMCLIYLCAYEYILTLNYFMY